MTATLTVDGLNAGYGRAQVLRDIAISVQEGELVSLVGPNGAGKSTLLKAISGLLTPSAGSIRFDGAELTGISATQIVELGVIQVPEGRHLFPDMSVADNLALGAYARRARAGAAAELERIYELFPVLKERRGQMVRSLSGGEQQMIAIGRGLMLRPRILILDEPSLGLAPKMIETMFATIEIIHGEGMGVLLVEQHVHHALALAQRAYVIENGRIAMSGPADKVRSDPEFERAYLGIH